MDIVPHNEMGHMLKDLQFLASLDPLELDRTAAPFLRNHSHTLLVMPVYPI